MELMADCKPPTPVPRAGLSTWSILLRRPVTRSPKVVRVGSFVTSDKMLSTVQANRSSVKKRRDSLAGWPLDDGEEGGEGGDGGEGGLLHGDSVKSAVMVEVFVELE